MSKRNYFPTIPFCIALLMAPADGWAQDTPETRAAAAKYWIEPALVPGS